MCQTLSKAFEMSKNQEIHLSHQQQDCYQKQFVFHVLLTVAALYMSRLAGNLIEKV